ncbi:MAG: hypothetical protein WCK31_05275 [bacterium]
MGRKPKVIVSNDVGSPFNIDGTISSIPIKEELIEDVVIDKVVVGEEKISDVLTPFQKQMLEASIKAKEQLVENRRLEELNRIELSEMKRKDKLLKEETKNLKKIAKKKEIAVIFDDEVDAPVDDKIDSRLKPTMRNDDNSNVNVEKVERNLDAHSVISAESDDLLETSLSQNFETENNIKTVSKELFSKTNIELKTEIDHDEINNITRLQFLKEKFMISNVDVLVQNFLKLRVSKDRKSRKEFIDALQMENRNSNAPSMMSKLFGGGGNGNNNV